MKNVARFLVSVPLVMIAALACAEPEVPQGTDRVQMDDTLFRGMDANGDGVVTREEFDTFSIRRFQELDANKDGKVTREEMDVRVNQAMRNGLRHFEERFSSADLNRDGVLDRVEAQAMPVMEVFFDQVDANKDGKVTREEYFAALPMLHKVKNIGPKGKDSAL